MKSYKRLFLLCLLTIGFFSCKTPVSMIGTYMSQNGNSHNGISVVHEFVIKVDSTFNYRYIIMGKMEKYSSGTWKSLDVHTIALISDIQSNIIPLNVDITRSNNENPVVNLKLVIPGEDEKIYRCTPYFAYTANQYMENFLPDRGSYSYEESNYYTNNHELYFKISKEPYEIIPGRGKREYNLLETEHKKMTLNAGDIVNVTVTIPDSLFSYRIFNDARIRFSGNKMIFDNSEGSKRPNKLYLVKNYE